MGDNIYLGDRNGVRTPMQWSRDRNAGFSSAEEGRLYLPVITDPVYGYQAVNVAAQARTPSSLLNTMRRLLAARRTVRRVWPGSYRVPAPAELESARVPAPDQRETLLIVANLSASPQPVELDLPSSPGPRRSRCWADPFSAHARAPYFLSLGPHGFYWFRLERPATATSRMAWKRARSEE